ncbi:MULTISPECIES: YeiH family protein [Bacillaceae]|uniref:YeiH family protein n=1 Tax=Bacillaceae TaxID=186817 RepID=UPI001049416F|nr:MULTISPECIES: YeiH family protein [Bacillaceae]MDT2046321.1 YeiH family protein [Priestia flexa]TDB49995.1 YeiH family protein [Bacillus sp. CBEL-1]
MNRNTFIKNGRFLAYTGGLAFTFAVAIGGYLLASLSIFQMIGPLACALLIAIIYRNYIGYPTQFKPGIKFASTFLLRGAIILYGLQLQIDQIFAVGIGIFFKDALVIILSITCMLLIGKWLKADLAILLLLGVGTGVCGAAAIGAVSPILKSKEEDIAISVGIIALIGSILSIAYPFLQSILDLSPEEYGIWSGMSLHEIAHVTLAAMPAGQEALSLAIIAKLGRVLWLIPLSCLFVLFMKRKEKQETSTVIKFPWFLVGFLLMSIFNSYILERYVYIPNAIVSTIPTLTTFLLTMAMVGLGLNVNIKTLCFKSARPLIAIIITSLLLSTITLVMI